MVCCAGKSGHLPMYIMFLHISWVLASEKLVFGRTYIRWEVIWFNVGPDPSYSSIYRMMRTEQGMAYIMVQWDLLIDQYHDTVIRRSVLMSHLWLPGLMLCAFVFAKWQLIRAHYSDLALQVYSSPTTLNIGTVVRIVWVYCWAQRQYTLEQLLSQKL